MISLKNREKTKKTTTSNPFDIENNEDKNTIFTNNNILNNDYTPTEIVSRKRETMHISDFIYKHLKNNDSGNLLIEGEKGTGKRTVTKNVVSTLIGQLPTTKVVGLSG